jgi:type II secretory pathway component PulC
MRAAALSLLLLALGAAAQAAAPAGWRLAGTFVSGSESWAIVENDRGEQRRLQVGDVLDGCRIDTITTTGLNLDCGSKRRWRGLQADPHATAAPAHAKEPPAAVQLPAGDFHELITHPQRLVSEVQLKPQLRDGSLYGYEVTAIQSGSLLDGHGVTPGDVIVGVDGSYASDPRGFAKTIDGMGDARAFVLHLQRDGVVRDLLVELR